MMNGEDYIKAKQRMLMVSEVADLMLRAPDKLRFDEATYQIVAEALAMNRDDVRSMFAEIDMLRASLDLPFVPEGREPDARPEGDGAVGGVPAAQDGDGSSTPRNDGAADGGGVQGGGAHGERPKRPKSRRHKKGNPRSAEGLDPGNSPEPMGGGEG